MGDEGGFAPCINSATEALDLIVAAIKARPDFVWVYNYALVLRAK